MTRKPVVLFSLLVTILIASPPRSQGASLAWKGGGADLWADTTQAVACTLVVTRDPALQSIDGYRTVWCGNGRIRFDSPYGQSHVPYSASAGASPRDKADAASSRETLDLGVADDSTTTELVVTILSGGKFDITLFEVKDGRALRWPLMNQPHVRINGGVGPPHRPEVISVSSQVSGDSVFFWLTGLGFALAQQVALAGAGAPGVVPFAVLGDTAIRASTTLAGAGFVRRIGVTTEVGVGSSIEADVRSSLPAQGPTRILAVLLESAPAAALSTIDGVAAMTPLDPSPTPLGPGGTSKFEDLSKIFVVEVEPAQDPAVVLADIRASSYVVSADIVSEGPELFAEANDPLWSEQWGLHDVTGAHCKGTIFPDPKSSVNLPPAWELAQFPPQVDIAIIDTGVELDHPDMLRYDPLHLGASFADEDSNQWRDRDNHGTAVASIAVGTTNNNTGLAGASRVGYPISVKWKGRKPNGNPTGGSWPAMSAAINFAATDTFPGRIINLSAGGPSISPSEKHALAKACKNAFLNDKLLICAAGNDHDSVRVWPAAFNDHALAVGATLWNNDYWTSERAWHLSADSVRGTAFGSWVDLMAPGGVGITAAWASTSDFYWSLDVERQNRCDLHYIDVTEYFPGSTAFGGTSAAAPLVAGVAGWLKRIQPTLSGEDLAQVMLRTATDMGASGFDVRFGNGRVNAAAAAALVTNPNWIEHGAVGAGGQPLLTLTADSVATSLTIVNATNLGIPNGTYACVRYRLAGLVAFSGDFAQVPTLWVRRQDSNGLPLLSTWDEDQQSSWGGMISPTTAGTAWFETYVYRLTGLDNRFVPCPPEGARIAYTAVAPSHTLDVSADAAPLAMSIRTRLSPARSRALFDATGVVAGPLRVEVFDVTGRRMATLHEGTTGGGRMAFEWDGRTSGGLCGAGMYLCRIEQPGRRAACRFALIR